jgi:hypothetical protein
MKPTFEIQYQKIVSAYYKNELKPLSSCACFIGNLLNNNSEWANARCYVNMIEDFEWYMHDFGINTIKEESKGLYSIEEIIGMESSFIQLCFPGESPGKRNADLLKEENLFNAMVSTLEMLRKIHESKGEIVKDYNFTKRELVSI